MLVNHMSRNLFNATIIPEVVQQIETNYQLSESEALRFFYHSDTARALNDPETGLYGQSALFIFSVFLQENPLPA